MKNVAIIGFGFCGIISFHHLVKKISSSKSSSESQKTKILIFDKNGKNALGSAFFGFNKNYILNVSAKKMSAFSDKPDDFVEFLKNKFPETFEQIGEDGFAPRYIYGEYLKMIRDQILQEAKELKIDYEFIDEEVVAIDKKLLISTKKNNSFQVEEIILATSFLQSKLSFADDSPNFISSLWSRKSRKFHSKNNFRKNSKICIIGSGLSAIDVLVGLKFKGFAEKFGGKVFVISRRGNLPKTHFQEAQKLPNFIEPEEAKLGILNLCLKFRKFLRENPNYDLRHLIDSIRQNTVKIWQNLDEKNKKIFLKKLLPYWNIFRHRVPQKSIEAVSSMINSSQLEIIKSSIKSIRKNREKFLVETKNRNLECDCLVNCLGFDFDVQNYKLLAQMIEEKLLKKDIFFIASNNPKVHLVGGLNIGKDFEITAVPDLRNDVKKLIDQL